MSYLSDKAVTGALGAGSATKDMSYLRKKPRVTELIAKGQGKLTDLSGNHEVELDWELNEVAVRDKVFKLTIDDKEVYLDLDELLYYTRIMFMKK